MGRGVWRIGIVGAGRVARERHLPGFRALPDCRVVGVCNRHRESTVRVAREFDIPRIFETWEDLVDDDQIDAVVISTWPYMHCPITLAALDAGKHVLTQSPMAMNAREAQRMLDRSRECPQLTAMIAPSPLGLAGDLVMRKLIAGGCPGPLREIHLQSFSSALADESAPITWRQIAKYTGFNMLNLGELYETVLRWVAPVISVRARASRFIPIRTTPESNRRVKVSTPDSIQVLTVHQDGSLGTFHLSGVLRHHLGSSIALHGQTGTLIYDLAHDLIRGARSGGPELHTVSIPDDLRGGWQAEADFLAALRGERPVTRTDFLTGARCMQFTEAVARSSRHQQPVDLPLKEFSNPSL